MADIAARYGQDSVQYSHAARLMENVREELVSQGLEYLID